jgi:hypothetical protein
MDRPKLWAVAVVTGDFAKPKTIRLSLGHRLAPSPEMASAMVTGQHYRDNHVTDDLLFMIMGEVPRDMVAAVLAELDRPPPAEPQKVVQLVQGEQPPSPLPAQMGSGGQLSKCEHDWVPDGLTGRRCTACGAADGGSPYS